ALPILTEQGLVTPLRVEVVDDHEIRLAAEAELPRERLAAVRPRLVLRVDATRAEPEVRLIVAALYAVGRRRRPTRPIAELAAPVGAEEEADTDVAARLAAVHVVHGIDLT